MPTGLALSQSDPDRYCLQCYACSRTFRDDGIVLHCPESHGPSFLRTVYRQSALPIDPRASGILRYAAWLPLREPVRDVERTAVFCENALGAFLRAPNVWIAFNGYWPERGALLPTATFKDLEAVGILGRFPRDGRTLVVASAGNTAAALARACGEYGVPIAIVAPESALTGLRFEEMPHPCVRFVSVDGESTYDDAIALAKRLAAGDDALLFEGGAANVARRDAIATTLLSAVEKLGRLPEYYVQAVGSGAGAIAAHEAARRLRTDGRYGSRLPRIMLVQNAPSTPIYDAWNARGATRSDSGRTGDEPVPSAQIAAPVLGTRNPPYSVSGGLHSILVESLGDVTTVTNDDVWTAARVFEELVGIDVEPAGAVALAGLGRLLAARTIDADATILLHVTGGGRRRRAPALPYRIQHTISVDRGDICRDEAVAGIRTRILTEARFAPRP